MKKKRAQITASGLATLMGKPQPQLDVLPWAQQMRAVFGDGGRLYKDPEGWSEASSRRTLAKPKAGE